MEAQVRGRMAVVVGAESIEFREVTFPKLKDDQVLIKVKASAICGSDLHIYKGKHPFAPLPCTFGHELSGEVIQKGAKVERVKACVCTHV